MARKYQWSPAKYRDIVAGNRKEHIEGLRNLVTGFEKSDGFDLRKPEKWTAAQRRKIRVAFKRLEILQAQPKRIVRAKGSNLRKLQEAFHGGIPSKDFKVAFIPDTEPKATLPGAKQAPPRVKVLKEGVSIQRKYYERVFIPFDQKRLVRDPKTEVRRAAEKIGPNAALYFVQVGEYQSLTGKSYGLIEQTILDWMQKYDGKQTLPETSGNRGDDPKHHHWKYWLNGLIGYILPKGVNYRKIGQMISKGRRAAQELARERQNFMKRKSPQRKRKNRKGK